MPIATFQSYSSDTGQWLSSPSLSRLLETHPVKLEESKGKPGSNQKRIYGEQKELGRLAKWFYINTKRWFVTQWDSVSWNTSFLHIRSSHCSCLTPQSLLCLFGFPFNCRVEGEKVVHCLCNTLSTWTREICSWSNSKRMLYVVSDFLFYLESQ